MQCHRPGKKVVPCFLGNAYGSLHEVFLHPMRLYLTLAYRNISTYTVRHSWGIARCFCWFLFSPAAVMATPKLQPYMAVFPEPGESGCNSLLVQPWLKYLLPYLIHELPAGGTVLVSTGWTQQNEQLCFLKPGQTNLPKLELASPYLGGVH